MTVNRDIGRSRWSTRTAVGNYSLNFSADADYVDFGNIYELAYDGAISAAFWYSPNTTTFGGSFIGKEKAAADYEGWVFETSSAQLQFVYVTSITSNDYIIKSTKTIPVKAGLWYHLGFVYNNRIIAYYMNGLVYASTLTRNTLTSSGDFTAIHFNLGNRNNSDGTSNINGKLHDVRVFASALTAPQMQNIYFTGTNPSTPSSWWKMDEGTGTSIGDDGTNNYTGTINGCSWSTSVPSRVYQV